MGEVGRVEVEADAAGLGPAQPAGEVLGGQSVAINGLAAGLGIEGVEIEPLSAGEQFQHLVEIGAHLVTVAGPAGIAAGGHDAAAGDAFLGSLEAAHIVGLPAVE